MTETQTEKTKFESPYKGQELAESHIQIMIGEADSNLIRSIRPRQGTLQITAQHLWSKLCNELRKRNITNFADVDEFEQFLTNCVIVDGAEHEQLILDSTRRGLSNGPTGGTTRGRRKNSSRQDGRARAKTIRPGDTSTENVVSDVQSGSGEKGREKFEQSEDGQEGSKVG